MSLLKFNQLHIDLNNIKILKFYTNRFGALVQLVFYYFHNHDILFNLILLLRFFFIK